MMLPNPKCLVLTFLVFTVAICFDPIAHFGFAQDKNRSKTAAKRTVVASSYFSNGAGGWTITGDAEKFEAKSGHIQASDLGKGDYWYFVAPKKFLGDKTSVYGGLLTFELNQLKGGSSTFHDQIVVLSDGTTRLTHRPSQSRPAVGWTRFRVGLDENAGWRNATKDAPATKEDLIRVLKNLDSLYINCEHSSDRDVGGLKDVVMLAFNAPCGRYKELIEELRVDISNAAGGEKKTIKELVADNRWAMSRIMSHLDDIEKLIKETEAGAELIKRLRAENQKQSVNPYTNKKIATKGGAMAATRAFVESQTGRRLSLWLGLALDAVEAGYKKYVKMDVENTLSEFAKRNAITDKEFVALYKAMSTDLRHEVAREKYLKNLQKRWQDAFDQLADCRKSNSKK